MPCVRAVVRLSVFSCVPVLSSCNNALSLYWINGDGVDPRLTRDASIPPEELPNVTDMTRMCAIPAPPIGALVPRVEKIQRVAHLVRV